MKNPDKHITMSKDLEKSINKICKEENKKFSKKVNELLMLALKEENDSTELQKIYSKVETLNQKVYIILELLKQIYSDMDFNNLSDPNKSFALNEFLKKVKGDKLDD